MHSPPNCIYLSFFNHFCHCEESVRLVTQRQIMLLASYLAGFVYRDVCARATPPPPLWKCTPHRRTKCTTKGVHIIAGFFPHSDKWTVSFLPKWNIKLGGLNLFRLTDFLGVVNWVRVARRPFVRFIFTSGPSVCFQGFFFFSLLPYLDGALVITSHAHFVFSIRRTSWIICPKTTLIFLFFFYVCFVIYCMLKIERLVVTAASFLIGTAWNLKVDVFKSSAISHIVARVWRHWCTFGEMYRYIFLY